MRSFRSAVAVVAALGLALLSSPLAHAQDTTLDPTVVVLDASGSMTAEDVDGTSRMDSAKQAVTRFLDQVPGEAQLGLVTYGTGTGSGEEEKEAGCRDITVLAEPGEKDTGALKDAVNGLDPRGYTPIGNSLLRANELLPKEGKRSIVLVSDGIDTCAPPPVCDVAKQLKDQGTDLVVHTIGFMVDEAARAELQCVADATGGTYSDASSTDGLTETLTRVATRSGTEYQLPTKQVQFSNTLNDAPEISVGDIDNPTRIHALLPPGGKNEAYAKVKLPDNMRLQVGYTLVPEFGTRRALEDNYGFFITANNQSDGPCHVERSGLVDIVGDHPSSGFIISKDKNEKGINCNEDYVYLHTHETFDAPDNMDMTLAFVPTKPSNYGDNSNKNASTVRAKESIQEPKQSDTEVSAQGLAFPDPTAESIKGSITADIVEGETQYFPVDVDWGQSLDVSVEVIEDLGADKVERSRQASRRLSFDVLNELQQPQKLLGEKSLRVSELNSPTVFGTERPISFGNAEAGSSAWYGGKHFIQVSFSHDRREERATADTQSIPVKYRITVATRGDAVTGPTFEASSATSSETSTAPQSSESTTATDIAQTSSLAKLLRYGTLIGILLAIIIVAIAVIVFITRRRRR